MDIERNGNSVRFCGTQSWADLRRSCALLHETISRRGFRDVTLDFSQCERVTQSVMLPLMPVVSGYRNEGVAFYLVPPQQENLRRLFENANWSHFISPCVHSASRHEGGHVPALNYGESEKEFEILDRVMDLILESLQPDRQTLKAVEWSLWEIMDNVSSHAESSVGGFVQATAFQQGNQVEFVVADGGVGIPQSIGIHDHRRAVEECINEGVTRDSTRNAGNGLYGSFRVAALSDGGQFELHSLRGHLYTDPDGSVVTRLEAAPYAGTSVRCRIGLDDEHLLDKALRFAGKSQDPGYDSIERRYETDEGIVLNLLDEAHRDVGSRRSGIRVRSKMTNLLTMHHLLVVDLDGIGVISSSFADEVFGRLFCELGPRSFMTRIELRNVDKTVEGLIDRAILQRTRLGNGEV